MATARLTKSAIKKYWKGAWDSVVQHKLAFAILQDKANVKYRLSGTSLEWVVEVGKYTATTRNPGDPIVHTPKNHLMRVSLPWSFYFMEDSITKEEKLMNRGQESLVDMWAQKNDRMSKHFREKLSYDFLNIDGNSNSYTANSLHGLPSFFGGSYSSGNEAAASDTYAGQSTALNGVTGVDNPVSDAWTPVLVKYNHADFGATWAAGASKALRHAITRVTRENSAEARPDAIITTRDLYIQYVNQLQDSQRYIVNGTKPKLSVGFTGAMVDFDGVMMSYDEDTPATTAYVLNFDHIHLWMLSEGQEMFDVVTDSNTEVIGDTVSVHFRGQMAVNPRYQAKLFPYS